MKYLILILLLLLTVSCRLGKPHVTANCEFKIPEGYRLSQNKAGKWAILNNENKVLTYSLRYRFYDFYSQDVRNDDVFNDSCKAKGFLKAMLNQKTMNTFK